MDDGANRPAISCSAIAMACDGFCGVEGTLRISIWPWRRKTQSVKVPPVSMAMRNSLSGLLFLRLGENGFDLAEVIQIVAGHHLQKLLDAFFAAFGVHTELLPLLGLQRFHQA
jgi:hypothetical protein